MEFQYIKAMRENNLTYGDLPEDAQTGIDQIKDIEKGINMLEKSGKFPTEKTNRKIKAMDKWVYYEILDYVNETDKNEDEIPFDASEIKEELSNEGANAMDKSIDPKGLKIEEELKTLITIGTKFTIDDIEDKAPVCYDALFEAYDPDEENGVVTSKYSLIEKDDNMFHLTQN